MYTIEKGQSYTPTFKDVLKAKKNKSGMIRRIANATMGREFMGLTSRHKVYVLYFLLSFMLVFAWNEALFWPNVLNAMNFANAGRLANKVSKGMSAR